MRKAYKKARFLKARERAYRRERKMGFHRHLEPVKLLGMLG